MVPIGVPYAYPSLYLNTIIRTTLLLYTQFALNFAENGAGHALLFTDNIASAEFTDFPLQELTFEAWISTSDICHAHGTIMSFAVDWNNGADFASDMNAFVIADPFALVACRGYRFVYPVDFDSVGVVDDSEGSCASNIWYPNNEWWRFSSFQEYEHYDLRDTNLYARDGGWHHLAVTYKYSLGIDQYKIFVDGLLVQVGEDDKGSPYPSSAAGVLVLGSDQDCLAGCTSAQQSFYGMMDEIKLWRRVLSEEEIILNMRQPLDVSNTVPSDLIAYWNFDTLNPTNHTTPDLSGNGHDLLLQHNPVSVREDPTEKAPSDTSYFKNAWAMNTDVTDMPDEDFTVEFWAQTPTLLNNASFQQPGIFSFASVDPGNGDVTDDSWMQDAEFLFDAISVSKHNTDYWSAKVGLDKNGKVSTLGAVSLHVNNYEIIFLANWTDNQFHHVAATWVKRTGESRLYFDEIELEPYAVIPPQVGAPLAAAINLDADIAYLDSDEYDEDQYDSNYNFNWLSPTPSPSTYNDYNKARLRTKNGEYTTLSSLVTEFNKKSTKNYADVFEGGQDPTRMSNRSSRGSLVLGQLQRNYGGGFSPRLAFTGKMGRVRVWSKAMDFVRIKRNMEVDMPRDKSGLVLQFDMQVTNGQVQDLVKGINNLRLGGVGPRRRLSYAPLASPQGIPLEWPTTPTGGYALRLHDQVTVMRPQMNNFPSDAITVEFWMQSTDTCREGTPFSYATGDWLDDEHKSKDNGFTVTDYNNWRVYVHNMYGYDFEDNVGVGATDGNWHYVAVTWTSVTGVTEIYQDGKLLFRSKRAQGKALEPLGTLVVGREQDCRGGCFSSDSGGSGDLESIKYITIQDFYGLIDEMRIWSRVLEPTEIYANFRKDSNRLSEKVDVNKDMQLSEDGLVARWSFDEGRGFVVNDDSGNENHLYISGEPTWVPVIIYNECGNGELEDFEECDDGNVVSGDGCSAKCRVEGGYTCTSESPSLCTFISQVMLESNLRHQQDQRRSLGKAVSIVIGVFVPLSIIVIIAITIIFRQRIYDQFPWIEDKVHRLFQRRDYRHKYNEYLKDNLQEGPYQELEFGEIQPANLKSDQSSYLESIKENDNDNIL
eukprot:TRINITY_DN1368_c0_g1_i9.p1 TRINITY_DN1368_c0_g1~~TRINITY_DN1368_c0_g1_i9.p1  ORF type:complete len:1131 (+),score=146.11 TRINITY_DN1368_c0_g1_i9:92-3394(+)